MPVILPREQWDAWLARGMVEPEAVAPMLTSLPGDRMQAWPVSRAVSKGSAEGEELIEPLPAA
jgi:putative SOS response-associated peptidase YedK